MSKTQKSFYTPPHELEVLARCLLPDIQKYFQSEQGKREFEQWKTKQQQNEAKTKFD